MFQLSQILGNSLMGALNGHTPAQINQMTKTLSNAQAKRARR